MKVSFSIVLAFFFCSSLAFAQVAEGLDKQSNLNDMGGGGLMGRSFDYRYEGTKGSPFVFDDFKSATLIFQNGKKGEGALINIDSYNNEVVYKRAEQAPPIILEKSKIFEIIVNDLMIERKFAIVNSTDGSLVVREIIFEGKFRYGATLSKDLLKADYQGAYSSNRPYDEFVDKSEFFVQRDNEMTTFKLNNRSLKSVFPKEFDSVKKFIKDKSLDLKNPVHVRKLFAYIDEQTNV